MTNKLESLNRIAPIMSHNDIDDYYLYVPFRKNNSIDYRNFVKSYNGQFDSIELRWSIKNKDMTNNLLNEIQRLNMFDGYKYNIRQDNPFYSNKKLDINNKCDILKPHMKNVIVAKEIKFDRRLSVQYFSVQDFDYVVEIFVDNYYYEDYDTISSTSIKNKILKFNLLPKEYARSNWKHYAFMTKSDSIRDMSVKSIQQLCDRFT